jgi:hypothetical protein
VTVLLSLNSINLPRAHHHPFFYLIIPFNMPKQTKRTSLLPVLYFCVIQAVGWGPLTYDDECLSDDEYLSRCFCIIFVIRVHAIL